jgi:hypothetical protein
MLQMIVPVETRHLFGSPNCKHLRATTEDTLNTVPVNLIKKAGWNNVMLVIVQTSLFVTPNPCDRLFITPSEFDVIKHDYQILTRQDPRDIIM